MIRYMNVYLKPDGSYCQGRWYESRCRAKRVRVIAEATGARCIGTAVLRAPV